MRNTLSIAATALLTLLAAAAGASAAEPSSSPLSLSIDEIAAACAPLPSVQPPSPDALRLAGGQDSVPRTAFGPRDLVVLAGGTDRGVRIDQAYYVRRAVDFADAGGILRSGERPIHTAGWVRVIAVNASSAIAAVEHTCGVLLRGDYLEPFAVPVLPAGIDRADTTGALDFGSVGRVLFGDMDRRTAGPGDYMVIDRGAERGATAGGRLAIYRDLDAFTAEARSSSAAPLPLSAIGEAVVVSAAPTLSLVRIVSARDAVRSGDLVVPRK